MRRYTLKENLISAAIGVAIGVPFSIYAVNHRTPVEHPPVQEIDYDVLKEEAEEAETEYPPLEAIPATEEEIEEENYEGELEHLAILVHAEAGNQDQIGKRLVVDVVLNRVDDPDFPDTIDDVIWQKYQFSTIWDGAYDSAEWTVTQSDYDAVSAELDQRLDSEILFFTAGEYGKYGTPAYQHGDHYFCYK